MIRMHNKNATVVNSWNADLEAVLGGVVAQRFCVQNELSGEHRRIT